MEMARWRGKTRDQVISELMGMANSLMKNYDYDLNNKMWDLCYDWNRDHYDGHFDEAEIFMGDVDDDNGNVVGFMIEDDVWYWPENEI